MILIDTREQKQDYIQGRLSDSGIGAQIVCLSHGIDYLIAGTYDCVGVQRKTFPEVAQQMKEIREDIVPALMASNDNPVLLVEEIFSIDETSGMIYRKENNYLKPTQISARMYYNFLNSIRAMGCEVVCTRNLDHSIWWMYSTHAYVHEQHYPKQKKRYGADMQALGALCCLNGFGQTTAKKILQQHSLQDLITMSDSDLIKYMSVNQAATFRKVVNTHVSS